MDLSPALALIPIFAVFIPALMLPGPDFIGFVRASMTRGTRAGLFTTIGVAAGLGVYATMSIVGLAAVLVQYHWLAVAVKVMGGLYLVYLGVRLLLTKPATVAVDTDGELTSTNARRAFLFGLGVTLTNLKAIVLFAAVFAPAITPSTPAWLMAAMVGLVMLSAGVWYACVALFMASAPVVRRFRNAQHRIERLVGGCFVLVGGRILIDARSPVTT